MTTKPEDALVEQIHELQKLATAGPWIVNPFVAQVDCEKISEKGGLLPVAQMLWPTDERSEDETEANAHLVALVPQMADTITTLLERERRLREALAGIEGRVDYAIGMYHDATRWASEDDPDDPETTLRDWVFAEARAALTGMGDSNAHD